MNLDINIIVKRSKRAKRINIRIDESTNIILTAPRHTSRESCEHIIRQHHEWITKHISKKRLELNKQTSILDNNRDKIMLFGDWIDLPKCDIKKYLKNRLEEHLEIRVKEIASEMGVEYRSIKTRITKSRWGSCSVSQKLNFSFLLIFAHTWVVDYVICHELAHLKYHNHSKDFWEFLEKHNKDHKRATAYLNEHKDFFLNIVKYYKLR